jgi:hypothetical protein
MPGMVVEVVEDSRGFAALEGEWDDLHRHSPLATPFQSWAVTAGLSLGGSSRLAASS